MNNQAKALESLKIAKDGRIYTDNGTYEKIGAFHVVIALLAVTQIVDIIFYAVS